MRLLELMNSKSLVGKIGPFGVCFALAFYAFLSGNETLGVIFVGLGNLFFLFGLLITKK